MFYKTEIEEKRTIDTYGYSTVGLSKGSDLPVFVRCTNCDRVIRRAYRNAYRNHQCSIVDGDNKRCFKCGEWKNLGMFNKAPKLSGQVSKMCRKCHNSYPSVMECERRKALRRKTSFENGDINYFITNRVMNVKNRVKKKKIDFDIDSEYMIELWEKQGGKCYYTKLDMGRTMKQVGFQAWDAPSIDRLDPGKGYTKGNVVWCISSVNSFKQSLTETQFLEMLKKIEWKQ